MKKTLFLLTALGAAAFPRSMMEGRGMPSEINELLAASQDHILGKRQEDALGISRGQSNCGPRLCPTFDPEDQFIDLTGEHQYIPPTQSDIRGPCPGLNAASNHGYLPRSGIATIQETVDGLGKLYNLGPLITAVLSAYAIALTGNIAEGTWSIGGPLPTTLLDPLLGTGQGLSYSHNTYEGDSSIGRGDAYLNNGDAHSLNVTRFEQVYNIAVNDGSDRYTLDKFRAKFEEAQNESIQNNPYYFTGAFSTVVVVPAAYAFVINLMSNHSAEVPSGYMDGFNLKSFFAVEGQPGSFVWNKGQERVPENWYRRPSYAPYEANDVVSDVALGYLAYPNTLKFGGNTGEVNTFTGLNVANVSGGLYDAQTLFEGNNFSCFVFQLLQQGIPDLARNRLNALAPVTNLVNSVVGPVVNGLGCPALGRFDTGLFDQFPGYTYSPSGPATNFKM